ncbi:HpcH/HpaI aldolase/citrate lyase family protein [Variovorax terrae]|uniref:CoA ester lyase n=1 Tax=Variovorax terrae TaxID=2923278 RepID=A0A9X1VUZ3_9BURK|nr:CoA ester lyase [Variovorax terrae]MCJ0762494.1 CoA ester lyase [Variovorax terrae]
MTRTFLFVPGDSQRKFERAITTAADALILDLEDSVAPARKPAARPLVRQMLAQVPATQQAWVRVNALDSGHLLQDLAAVMPARPYGIVLPKCQGREALLQAAHYLDAFEAQAGLPQDSTRILAIVTETAQSIFGLGSYAHVTPRLWGLSWGAEDLAADVGSLGNRHQGRYTEPYRLARSLCLYAAAAAGVRAIDTVCVELDEPTVLADEAQEACRDGFAGKLAIHPRHVEAINAAFTPDESQLAWAARVLEAFERNPDAGTFNLDGKMIDQPHLRLARRLMGRA